MEEVDATAVSTATEVIVRPAMVECTVEVQGDVLVCDPCYFTGDGTEDPGDEGFRFEGTGTWKVTTELESGGYGRAFVIKELIAVKSGSTQFHGPEKHAASLGVDAGLMAFIPEAAGPIPDWQAFCKELEESGRYEKVDPRDGQPGVFQGRVVSDTAYGDGVYPCYVREDEEGNVVQVRVCFDEDPEDGDAEEWG